MKNLRSGVLLVFSALISISSQSLDSPTNDGCGKASKELAEALSISAQTAYDCLIDVPFQKDDAVNTLKQLKLYLQFNSAQAYFADPPTPELELTPVDLNKTLSDIESNINSGKYKNEYSFNKDLFNLFGSYRDGHVAFTPLCYAAFHFRHEYSIVSVAKTPNSIPEIYAVNAQESGYGAGDKIVQINGQKSVDYLTKMANTHPELTWVDPDARYNQLLMHSFGGVYKAGVFAFTSVYPTEDLTLTWENGTTTKVVWRAVLSPSVSADSFHSTDTFYKKVCIRPKKDTMAVLGDEIAINWGGDDDDGDDHDHQRPTVKRRSELKRVREIPPHHLLERAGNPSFSVNRSITPPVVEMDDGELSLYILDHETGVLVVNAFTPKDRSVTDSDDAETTFMTKFVSLATESISYLRQRGISKIIIDISGNGGGFATLGQNLALQFFPKSDHFFGTNMRWNPTLQAMLTSDGDINATNWDLGHYKKMDGSDFDSYQEFLGPVHRDNDYFTVIAIPDTVETIAEDSVHMPSSYEGPQPFDTDNIVLLSSGMCGSTCAIFAEAMLERGVHSVSFGGRPQGGPMQTVGGIKGSQVLKFDNIAYWANKLLGGDASKYDLIPTVLNVATVDASINFRNSWRKDDQKLPIEFIYNPSEHRLSYTAEMLTNQTVLWQATKDVTWGGAPDLCAGKCKSSAGKVTWDSLGELIWLKLHGHSES